jgi:hypothetical protein
MALAEVIDLRTARRAAVARHLIKLGCPLTQVTATTTDIELDQLRAREQLIADLTRLTGWERGYWSLHNTDHLLCTKQAVISNLMGVRRDIEPPHTPPNTRNGKTARRRRRQQR